MAAKPPMVQGGNVKQTHAPMKNIHVSFLRANGKPARLFKLYLDAALELGLTYTGSMQYRRFPARMIMLGFVISGPVTHADGFKDAYSHVMTKYRNRVDCN